MSNIIHIHLDKYDKIEVCENLDFDKECTPLKFGEEVTILTNKIHLEELFEHLDKKLHKETYSDLEDKVFTLQDNFDELLERNITLIEQAVGE